MQKIELPACNHALAILFVTSLALSVPMKAADTNSPAWKLVHANRPLVIGHRGYSAFAPENTLPSFKLALAAGADLVELDYHHSKDGIPVVIHDGELDRTTDAVKKWGQTKIKVGTKTVSEIQSLDAGSWFDARYAGTKIPMLTEALDFIQQGGVTLIERKAGDAATCVKLLREKSLINRVVVQSFDWEYIRDFHQQAPEQVLGALGPPSSRTDGKKLSTGEKVLNASWLDAIEKTGTRLVVWSGKSVTKEVIQLAHRRGFKVWVYTIDDPAEAVQLLDSGVDAIISNNPALIWKALATMPYRK
jgi:glycerophosphoryl diester phosphodiesterase